MADRIINSLDYAKRAGVKSGKDLIIKTCKEMIAKGIMDPEFAFQDVDPVGAPVYARIDFGQWIANCPDCKKGAESVNPDEPIFYCFSCGNVGNHGKPRAVIFPGKKDRENIEKLLLERPVNSSFGVNAIMRMSTAKPFTVKDRDGNVVVLSRSWDPGETVKDLSKQNKLIKKIGGGE